jgi:hypothetical protein
MMILVVGTTESRRRRTGNDMATFSQWEDLRRRPRGAEPWPSPTTGSRFSGARFTGATEARADARHGVDGDAGSADATPGR